jgi:hypothetical protein
MKYLIWPKTYIVIEKAMSLEILVSLLVFFIEFVAIFVNFNRTTAVSILFKNHQGLKKPAGR